MKHFASLCRLKSFCRFFQLALELELIQIREISTAFLASIFTMANLVLFEVKLWISQVSQTIVTEVHLIWSIFNIQP